MTLLVHGQVLYHAEVNSRYGSNEDVEKSRRNGDGMQRRGAITALLPMGSKVSAIHADAVLLTSSQSAAGLSMAPQFGSCCTCPC